MPGENGILDDGEKSMPSLLRPLGDERKDHCTKIAGRAGFPDATTGYGEHPSWNKIQPDLFGNQTEHLGWQRTRGISPYIGELILRRDESLLISVNSSSEGMYSSYKAPKIGKLVMAFILRSEKPSSPTMVRKVLLAWQKVTNIVLKE